MRFFDDLKDKLHHTHKKRAKTSAFMLAFFLLVIFLFADGANVRAQTEVKLKNENYEIKIPEVCEYILGSLAQDAPDGPYLKGSDGTTMEYAPENKYGDDSLSLFLTDWEPSAAYIQKIEKGVLSEWTETKDSVDQAWRRELSQHQFEKKTDYGHTFYWLTKSGDNNQPDFETVRSGFAKYVKEKTISSGSRTFEFRQHGGVIYGISTPFYPKVDSTKEVTESTAADCLKMERELNSYLNEYMAQLGAKEYDDRQGVVIGNEGEDVEVTFIRVELNRLRLYYFHSYNEFDENLQDIVWNKDMSFDNNLPILTFSGSSFPLNLIPKHVIPAAVTVSGEEISSGRNNKVLKDEAITLQYGENAEADDEAGIYYVLSDKEYTDSETAAWPPEKWKKAAEDEQIELQGTEFEGNQRCLYIKVFTTNQDFLDSPVEKYKFSLGKNKALASIRLVDEKTPPEDMSKVDVGERIRLLWNDEGQKILYTLDGSEPQLQKFHGSEEVKISDLEQLAGTGSEEIIFIEKNDQNNLKHNYLKLNAFWYQCSEYVKFYGNPITADSGIRKNSGMTLRMLPVQTGLEPGLSVTRSLAWEIKTTTELPEAKLQTTAENPTEISMGDVLEFSCKTSGSELFYTTDGTIPVVIVNKRTGETVPGNTSTTKCINSRIEVTKAFAEYGKTVNLRVKAVCYEGGYQAKQDSETLRFPYKVKVTVHDKPSITMSNGAPVEGAGSVNSILKNDSIKMKMGLSGAKDDGARLNYCIYASDYSTEDVIKLNQWTETEENADISLWGTSLPGTKRNLYIKVKSAQDNYVDSEVLKFSFIMDKTGPLGTITLETEDKTPTLDVGDKVILSSSNPEAAILYTLEENAPVLTRYTGDGNMTIEELESRIAGMQESVYFVETTDYNYLKVNGFWYRCPAAMHKFKEPFPVGEEIREKNRLQVRAFLVQEGFELGDYMTLSAAYELKQQVQTPASDIATTDENPTVVGMGSGINFTCATSGSEIFYTTNGSAPVVTINTDGNHGVEPGNEATKKYDANTAVRITEELAGYDSNIAFMVKAVYYRDGIRIMKDSEVAKFVYHVEKQSPVENVSAIPATDEISPATVKEGTKIMLYCKTPGAAIYYTTDGTEPLLNEDGTMAGNTKQYNASQGILVPGQQDTLFTITAVAYAPGFAGSEIVRLVYKYPAAVSAPYASPGSGTVSENTAVTLKASTEGAVIYYETANDGETPKDPSADSNVFDEASPIIITRDTIIKAVAVSGGVSSTVNTFQYSVASKLSVPMPSLQSGAVISRGTSIFLSAQEGAAIYYTTDGSNPSDAANKNVNIGNSVLLDGTAGSVITIRTYASKAGYSNSEVGNYSYSISNYTDAIFADKESGTIVKNNETVKLDTDVTNAEIYYTTDGTVPTIYSAAGRTVTISGEAGSNVIVKAVAVLPGSSRTAAAATFTYTIMNKLKAPQSNVPGNAIFTEEGQVVLTAESGAIHYTTDGTEPSAASSVYHGSVTVDKSMTIKAVAVAEGSDSSDVSTFVYTFADRVEIPVTSIESGEVEVGTQVALNCATEGASIYYTTDGTDPDMDDKGNLNTYNGEITISQAMTLKAVAAKTGMQESPVLTVSFTVREPVVKEETNEGGQGVSGTTNESGRLQSRRTFSGENAGPSFKDILLKNSTYGVLVASDFDVIPDETSLSVAKTQAKEAAQNLVKQNLGEYYSIISSFDISLNIEGEEVQPQGTIELGIPIPAEYENAVLYVVHVGEDGTVKVEETRRSAGMAYAKVNHLSEYSIAAPEPAKEEEGGLWKKIAIGAGIAAVLAGAAIAILRQRTKYYDR